VKRQKARLGIESETESGIYREQASTVRGALIGGGTGRVLLGRGGAGHPEKGMLANHSSLLKRFHQHQASSADTRRFSLQVERANAAIIRRPVPNSPLLRAPKIQQTSPELGTRVSYSFYLLDPSGFLS
jgi:hypothetical protein